MSTAADQVLFAHVVDRPDDEIELDVAALLIGDADQDERVEIDYYLELLDRFADSARDLMTSADLGELAPLRALNQTLFGELGFRGNQDDYYDPRNSYLHQVIERKVGIPITLSVLYIEVARRLGVTINGVGFPGHFLVRYDDPDHTLVLDPFHMGMVLDAEELTTRLQEVVGNSAQLSEDTLRPVTKKRILLRMLANLAGIHHRNGDVIRSVAVLERMHILAPDDAGVERELERLKVRAGELN
jgi:regulator of sirC expression with transglutaminase-like and TPR domain